MTFKLLELGKYRPVVIGITLFLLIDAAVLGLNFHIANQLAASARTLATVGRQRTLSQQIVKGLLQLDNAVAIGADPEPILREFKTAYQLFDGALAAVDAGGFTFDAESRPIYIDAVTEPEGRFLVDKSTALWERFEEALAPVVNTTRLASDRNFATSTGMSDEDTEALQATMSDLYTSIDFVSENSLEMLALMNAITTYFERQAEREVTWLRTTQIVAMLLALVFFFLVLLHFARVLHRSDVALRRSEREFRTVFETSVAGLFKMRLDGQIVSANPALIALLGYDDMDDLRAGEAGLDPARRAVRAETMAQFCTDRETVQNAELELTRKDGQTVSVLASYQRLDDEDGTPLFYEGSFTDHSERKLLEAQLAQAQKLESIGQLAAGIAHEINTPTQFVGDNIRFLKESFDDLTLVTESHARIVEALEAGDVPQGLIDAAKKAEQDADLEYLSEEIPNAIDQSVDGVARIANIVRAMKEFSHPGGSDKEVINLNRAIESTVTVASNEWKYVAAMETDFDPDLIQVPCFPQEFNQVILNIVVNAAHAIGDKVSGENDDLGKITIATKRLAGHAEVRITDTGGGIPEHVRSSIFNPFFTTKEVGKGTGQGLSIAYNAVVEKHGGSLSFETEDGVGTTFIIMLPLADETDEHEAAA